MKTVKLLYGQTMTDIAIQELGDLERVFEIAVANNKGITDDLAADSFLEVGVYNTDKRSLVQLFSDAANKPASADIAGEVRAKLEGIGYWYLGVDFIVQ